MGSVPMTRSLTAARNTDRTLTYRVLIVPGASPAASIDLIQTSTSERRICRIALSSAQDALRLGLVQLTLGRDPGRLEAIDILRSEWGSPIRMFVELGHFHSRPESMNRCISSWMTSSSIRVPCASRSMARETART